MAPEDYSIETPDRQRITFHSIHANHRLTRVPESHIVTPIGTRQNVPGKAYEFVEGLLTLRVGQDELEDYFNPETGQVEKQDAVDWIRRHRLFGTRIVELPPVAPSSQGALTAILHALAQKDEDRLVEIFEAERKGFQRGDVLAQARNALEALESARELEEVRPEDAARGTGVEHKPVRDPNAPFNPDEEPAPENTVEGAPPKPSRRAAAAGFDPDGAEEIDQAQAMVAPAGVQERQG